MKITKWITVEREIEVDLDVEDLRSLVLEAEFADQRVEVLVSRAVTVLRAIPMERLNEATRHLVAVALRDEARRYATRFDELDRC
jgi:hypothetical protein